MKVSVLSVLALVIASACAAPQPEVKDTVASSSKCSSKSLARKRNLIMMVSDGFGTASETMARNYVQQMEGKPYEWLSALDELLVGTSRTKSSDSLVTDSAAGATVFSCAKKSYNGAIGVTPNEKPCGTVLEAAKIKGYTTALVSTARITHATPAAFASHVVHRDMEGLIAQQLVGNNTISNKVDLLFGGGSCNFLPNTTKGSCRTDDLDVWALAKNNGYSAFESRAAFDALKPKTKLPTIGLFTSSHMSYEIDRNPALEPSLAEMTVKALEILSENTKHSDQGFFIMIEGARIDMAGHDNDPAAHLRDIVQYWETVAAVRRFVNNNRNTAMIGTSDHETGGLALGMEHDYFWHPKYLKPVKKSSEVICRELAKVAVDERESFVRKTVIPSYLGVSNVTDADVASVVRATASGSTKCKLAVGLIVSRLARISWSTDGHSGVDVGLYAYGRGTEKLRGNYENTQVGEFLRDYLQVDLAPVTKGLSNQLTEQPGFEWARAPPSIVTRRSADKHSSGSAAAAAHHAKLDSYHPLHYQDSHSH
ncbi:vacuolar alkaline phosphatase [Coemansia sp. RSA 922]|nr:vacuolar alkaline phosphatase [Coemansia sp. S3946]KAJ2054404.1 vacuolar alkaline phosphatase [Coemansia sp. S16]KAJ2065528.1 vacuolar alkaline phosphatase [Coemansia sp. S2]KAJ2116339.1 vacuolar alkaline phosphatase [Coemansia sp. RSA 922]